MSHQEQHFAGLHYAKVTQIGAKFDDPDDNPYHEDSPNSPTLSQLQILHNRVYKKRPQDYFDITTIDGICKFYTEGDKATRNLDVAQKYGFEYYEIQPCHTCGAVMEKSMATYKSFVFPVWFCERCECYYTTEFDGVEDYTCDGFPVKTQQMWVEGVTKFRK